jgi:putative GTP pyrophosphokinase
MRQQLPNKGILQKRYGKELPAREAILKDLEAHIKSMFAGQASNFTVKGRVKSFDSFFRKYLRYLRDGINGNAGKACDDEAVVIPDKIGIRVVCPFIEDTSTVEALLKSSFEVVEVERKGSSYSFKEFGYESIHYLIALPQAIGGKYKRATGGDFTGEIVEIQIRTILQDAWAEVEHELVYKAEFRPFDHPMKRKLAALNATLSLADTIFQEIRAYERNFNAQLGMRKESFFRKVDDAADVFPRDCGGRGAGNSRLREADALLPEASADMPIDAAAASIDDLLLGALYAHNRGLFSRAADYYSHIIGQKPDASTLALIYKHRGMALFAQSLYEEAINDFRLALQLNEKSYQAAYYCGVVRLVLQQYADAADDFTRSLAINAFQPYCFYRRAEAYFHIEDYPQALSDCEAALSLDHELEGAAKLKAVVLEKLRM